MITANLCRFAEILIVVSLMDTTWFIKTSGIIQNGDAQGKRAIISSMYRENLTFDGTQHRTTRLNEAIRVFDSVKAVLEEKNKDKSTKKVELSIKVAGRGELPSALRRI